MNNRRKNYFIKRRFQASFFIKFSLLLFLEAILISLFFMLVARGTLTTAYTATGLTIQKTGLYFMRDLLMITAVAGIAMGLAGAFVFMYLTHRLGGPLYKFETILKEATQGDLTSRIQLRQADQLKDLAEAINGLLDTTSERIVQVKSDIKNIEQLVSSGNLDDLNKSRDLLEKTRASLENFRTSK